jgi:hypothetical protein
MAECAFVAVSLWAVRAADCRAQDGGVFYGRRILSP